jgi:hypothetical protein
VPLRSASRRCSKANAIRIARSRLKARLAARETTASALLLSPPAYVESMKLHKLLHAIPMFGPVKARKLMLHARVSEAKTVGGLSGRQRDEVVALLLRSGEETSA